MILSLMFEGLTSIDGVTNDVVPNLASHWTLKNKGQEVWFYLRPDLKWSDGHPLTADDVVFTFKLFNLFIILKFLMLVKMCLRLMVKHLS